MYTRSKYNIKIDFDKSRGSYVYDKTRDQSFLDFFNQYATLPLGYNFFADHASSESDTLWSLFCNKIANCEMLTDEGERFYKEFTDFPGKNYKNFHFTCTGGLAVESALKIALDRKDYGDILTFHGNFHGITGLGMFVTNPFKPIDTHLLDIDTEHMSIYHLDYERLKDDLEGRGHVNSIIVEPIQSTYGDRYIPKEHLHILRDYCDDKDALLIFDEVQTGFGATGTMWYSEQVGVKPDVLVFGKKAQVSGIMTDMPIDYAKQDVTWPGDLIDMLRCRYVMKAIKKYDLLDNVRLMGQHMGKYLKDLQNFRCLGTFGAFDFDTKQERDGFVEKLFDKGLLVNATRDCYIRLRLNLATTMDELKEGIEIIRSG